MHASAITPFSTLKTINNWIIDHTTTAPSPTAERHGVALAVMPLVAALYDQAIVRGEGSLDTAAAFCFPLGT